AQLLLETIVQGYLYLDINAYESKDLSRVPNRLPSSIARPFVGISEILGMKPVISYASITLANVRLAKGKEDAEFIAENLEVLMPRIYFENSDKEGYDWFFKVTAEIEASFARAITSIGFVCYEHNRSELYVEEALTAIINTCEMAQQSIKVQRL
ncbi:hypothetical protein PENTCL1PPCAC_28202, partial [Pristionchus entomophagus]